ncbi:MAG: hypothetical protein ACYCUG_06135 [Acidimicrobiales bacterium]
MTTDTTRPNLHRQLLLDVLVMLERSHEITLLLLEEQRACQQTGGCPIGAAAPPAEPVPLRALRAVPVPA